MPEPLYWSKRSKKIEKLKIKQKLQTGDYLILRNPGMAHFVKKEAFEKMIQKMITPFHQEGIKALSQLLSKELHIQEQKSVLHDDARVILIKIQS